MSPEASTAQSLAQTAAEMLSQGQVALVIGYAPTEGKRLSPPVFVTTPEEAQRLGFDSRCFGNLSVYLWSPQVRQMGKTAVVVKGCDVRAVNVLLRENVIKREDIVLIGVRCGGVGDLPAHKCTVCDCRDPQGCDVVIGDAVDQPDGAAEGRYSAAEALEEKSLDERREFWQGQLDKCIRCYACRQVCPLCYCKRCIVEKSTPQWVETSAHPRGNLSWNVVRAFHLAGRCVGCGECERVCPMNIPLGAINQKMAKLMEDEYDFRSGMSPEEKAPFTTFSTDDTDEGIL